uniref:Uncharacterized protein n=1 Tax=Kalanchoe fedtschenkoi TaxID=63787 RepID=A0A7N0RHT4_KALFE
MMFQGLCAMIGFSYFAGYFYRAVRNVGSGEAPFVSGKRRVRVVMFVGLQAKCFVGSCHCYEKKKATGYWSGLTGKIKEVGSVEQQPEHLQNLSKGRFILRMLFEQYQTVLRDRSRWPGFLSVFWI